MHALTLGGPDAPRVARQTVAEHCREAGTGPECVDLAVLATSEVVTNALVHGSGAVGLRVHAGPVQVRIEVGDDNPRHPRLRPLDEQAQGGRGMMILDAVSSAWGVVDMPVGKIVWFEVPAQP